jgi:hypothetical protein
MIAGSIRNRRAKWGMTAIKALNAAQAIAEIEMAKALAFRSLLAKNAVSEWELLTRQPQA